jgi:hypothetical protein
LDPDVSIQLLSEVLEGLVAHVSLFDVDICEMGVDSEEFGQEVEGIEVVVFEVKFELSSHRLLVIVDIAGLQRLCF